MLKVKIFKESLPYYVSGQFQHIKSLEDEVNEFLADNPRINVFKILQSSASDGESTDFAPRTVITIWYT